VDVEQVFDDYEPRGETPMHDYVFCTGLRRQAKRRTLLRPYAPALPECRRVQYTNPAPGVTVLVVDGDRLLLCRRSLTTSLRPGGWGLPGGHVEWNEDFLTAGVREVREETGVDVEIESILTVFSYFCEPERHYLAVVLLGHALGGQPEGDGVETDAARWFSIHEPLPEFAFPGDRHIVARYFAAPFIGAPIDLRYAKRDG
jgi:ADP-ribose pyrophosphatase YjhB (NUDIX family)